MTDILGWRHCFGVLGPSTNTIVQPDMEAMRPAGVTNHYSRIFTPNAQAVSNDTFMAGVSVIGQKRNSDPAGQVRAAGKHRLSPGPTPASP